MPRSQNPWIYLPSMVQRLQKKIFFAELFETTFQLTAKVIPRSDRRLGSLVLPKRLGNVKVVVNINYGMENVMVVQ